MLTYIQIKNAKPKEKDYPIKDFGNLMPGHGGLLDRMDAFIMLFFIHFLLMSFNINFIELYA